MTAAPTPGLAGVWVFTIVTAAGVGFTVNEFWADNVVAAPAGQSPEAVTSVSRATVLAEQTWLTNPVMVNV